MDSTEVMKALFSGSGEMADTQVLGTCVFGRAGSSPASRTHLFIWLLYMAFLYLPFWEKRKK